MDKEVKGEAWNAFLLIAGLAIICEANCGFRAEADQALSLKLEAGRPADSDSAARRSDEKL